MNIEHLLAQLQNSLATLSATTARSPETRAAASAAVTNAQNTLSSLAQKEAEKEAEKAQKDQEWVEGLGMAGVPTSVSELIVTGKTSPRSIGKDIGRAVGIASGNPMAAFAEKGMNKIADYINPPSGIDPTYIPTGQLGAITADKAVQYPQGPNQLAPRQGLELQQQPAPQAQPALQSTSPPASTMVQEALQPTQPQGALGLRSLSQTIPLHNAGNLFRPAIETPQAAPTQTRGPEVHAFFPGASGVNPEQEALSGDYTEIPLEEALQELNIASPAMLQPTVSNTLAAPTQSISRQLPALREAAAQQVGTQQAPIQQPTQQAQPEQPQTFRGRVADWLRGTGEEAEPSFDIGRVMQELGQMQDRESKIRRAVAGAKVPFGLDPERAAAIKAGVLEAHLGKDTFENRMKAYHLALEGMRLETEKLTAEADRESRERIAKAQQESQERLTTFETMVDALRTDASLATQTAIAEYEGQVRIEIANAENNLRNIQFNTDMSFKEKQLASEKEYQRLNMQIGFLVEMLKIKADKAKYFNGDIPGTNGEGEQIGQSSVQDILSGFSGTPSASAEVEKPKGKVPQTTSPLSAAPKRRGMTEEEIKKLSRETGSW